MSVAPIELPEFGATISWIACRNTMCANFGICYDGREPGPNSVSNKHFTLSAIDAKGRVRATCRKCRQSFYVLANRSIRAIARYFLSQSLPFSDCPHSSCSNHGINIYEHRRKYGRVDGEHRVRCKGTRYDVDAAEMQRCKQTFTLGESSALTKTKTPQKTLRDVYTGFFLVANISRTIDYAGIAAGTYYTHAHKIGARIQQYLSWRNAKLLKARTVGQNKTIRVYTDVLVISLSRLGEGNRQKLLHVIASVIALDRSYYILAVHPCFLPKNLCPDEAAVVNDIEKKPWDREWECLEHPHAIDWSLQGEDMIRNLPDGSRKGYFIETPYAKLAHFLVVQKMLARFKKVVYYMDADDSLFKSALLAMRNNIKQERAEIILFQHNKDPNTYPAVPQSRPGTIDELKPQWKYMECRFNKKREVGSGEAFKTPQKTLDARLFRSAMDGGYSKNGGWAWLDWPPDNKAYRGCKTLWLTRKPNKTFNDIKAFLMQSTLQPVDSAFASIRAGVNGAQRPLYRATGGPSYSRSYHEPRVVNDELQVYLLLRNFTVRWRARKKPINGEPSKAVQPPARLLGLTTPMEKIIDPLYVVRHFRLGLEHAEVISKWTRK